MAASINSDLTGSIDKPTHSERLLQTTIVSNVATGCYGIGGSPGESVWLFGGASPTEPSTVQKGDDFIMNIDRGNQAGRAGGCGDGRAVRSAGPSGDDRGQCRGLGRAVRRRRR